MNIERNGKITEIKIIDSRGIDYSEELIKIIAVVMPESVKLSGNLAVLDDRAYGKILEQRDFERRLNLKLL